jgi:hypothetical protein
MKNYITLVLIWIFGLVLFGAYLEYTAKALEKQFYNNNQ